MFVNLHDSRLVAAAVAVIRRCFASNQPSLPPTLVIVHDIIKLTGENRHHIPILTPIIPLHHQLMRPRHKRQPIIVIKRLTDILPKRIPRSSRADPPPTPIIRIRPQQVAHGPFVRHLLDPVERADVVQRVDRRRKAAVQAEDLVVDERGQGQVVEEVGEEFPHVGVAVFAQTFVVEAVDLGDLAGFVVAAEDGDALGVSDFERNEEGDGLNGEVAAVDVVAHEEVVGVWIGAADFEELHQVVELAVDVAADGHRALDRLHVRLVLEDLARLLA